MIIKPATKAANEKIALLIAAIAGDLATPDKRDDWPTEEIVRQAWADLVAWDRWIDTNRRSLPADELQLHEMTVRWAKGIVKSWRYALTGRLNSSEEASKNV